MSSGAVSALGRSTRWELTNSADVAGDVGHPQGLTRWGDGWLASTVHPGPGRGEILEIAGDGEVVRCVDVTDGERIHPGGLCADAAGCWIAVAEYRPRSTTTVLRVDRELAVVESFVFDDHLGAVSALDDGTLFAVSWASRRWYRLDTTGRILDQRTTPTRWVDLQDVGAVDAHHVVATGVGSIGAPNGSVQFGGLVVIDVDALVVAHETPVSAWMPSGRVATYNGAHIDMTDDDLAAVMLHCLVDDTTGAIGTWSVQPHRNPTATHSRVGGDRAEPGRPG